MNKEVQVSSQALITKLTHSNPLVEKYFQAVLPEDRIYEIERLLFEGIQRRSSMQLIDQKSLAKKNKRDVASKITQMEWNPIFPIKIFGKPKKKMDNQSSCVVHGLSHCSSQVTLNSKQSLNRVHNSRESQEGKGGKKLLKIQRVVELKQSPFLNQSNLPPKMKSTKKVCQEYLFDYDQKKHVEFDEQVLNAANEIEELIQVKRSNHNEQERLILEKTLLLERSKLQKMEEKLKRKQLKYSKNQELECSCCSEDSEVIKKLEEIYFTHSKHLQQQKRSQKKEKKDKTYKINASSHYPISSREQIVSECMIWK